VPQSGTFKNFSGFYKSAKRYKTQANVGGTSCRRKIFFIVVTSIKTKRGLRRGAPQSSFGLSLLIAIN